MSFCFFFAAFAIFSFFLVIIFHEKTWKLSSGEKDQSDDDNHCELAQSAPGDPCFVFKAHVLATTASIGARPQALLGLMILAHASAATHVFAAKAH